jgi:hypothetical protein
MYYKVNINMDNNELERRRKLWEQGFWEIPDDIDCDKFDFNWRPYPYDRPYVHEFGTQWQRTGGPRFVVPEYEGIKYRTEQQSKKIQSKIIPSNFKVLVDDNIEFDYSWHPDNTEPPFIWVFGNQHLSSSEMPTVEYHVTGATERKFVTDVSARIIGDPQCWRVLIPVDSTFDFNWTPHPYDPPYIYVWGNKWNDATIEPTVEYHMSGATDRKYITDSVANLEPTKDNWTVSNPEDNSSFDFSWRPNPFSPPQIYQWENNGPVYTVPNATEIVYMTREDSNDIIAKYYVTTTLEDLIEQHSTEVFWALNRDLNYDKFDFNWKPTSDNFRHINVFGTSLSKDVATYYINGPIWSKGFRELNYIDYELDIVTDLDMFYVNRGNNSDQFDQLKLQFPQLQKTRYASSWIDTINRCIKKSSTKLIWILSSEVDYSEFQFDFYPSHWQRNMIHVFGTQWSHWGNTYMINTESFETDTKYLKQIEHVKNINFVRRRRAKISQCLHDIVYIDFGNKSDSLYQLQDKCDGHQITVLSYDNSYIETLTKWVNSKSEYEIKQEHYVWVCSSLCDYENFDFTWVGDPFQFNQVHVFSSKFENSRQKFGDTFFININEFKKESEDLTSLEAYSKSVNYIGHITVPRLKHPVIEHDYDSQADAIMKISNRNWPYYELINGNSASENKQNVVPNMWDSRDHQIIITSTGSSRIFVPDISIDIVQSEVYDYPNIKMSEQLDESKSLDIVFFSNGEPNADENYDQILKIVSDQSLSNRVVRVKDVVGRVASQHAAANVSNTSWYFLVNGKLKVNPKFDFSWQPDRLQRSKHYIFMATNPVNHLEYGHQAIVANNKRLTLLTDVRGLDFTMDSAHEVVDMNSGVAIYNTDSWTTWRTAFRECIKLKHYSVVNDNQQNLDRLNTWLTVGDGKNGQWSTGGAYDAMEYYESVNGELSELMKSYDWAMLKKLYDSKYS